MLSEPGVPPPASWMVLGVHTTASGYPDTVGIVPAATPIGVNLVVPCISGNVEDGGGGIPKVVGSDLFHPGLANYRGPQNTT